MNLDCDLPFQLGNSWQEVLFEELNKPYIKTLADFVENERLKATPVYPPKDLVFNAFHKTPYDKVKVLIMGQDPYHGPRQAHGLSFSVPFGVDTPPSLKNIYKELAADIQKPVPSHGCLSSWAEQGVMLLNSTLTVRQSEPMSHYGKGWERFTDAVVAKLVERKDPIIFVLWGRSAQDKVKHIQNLESHHAILKASHPSPLSAYQGFMGCKHFSKINTLLQAQGKETIQWTSFVSP